MHKVDSPETLVIQIKANMKEGATMVIGAEAFEIKPELATKEGLLNIACVRTPETLTPSEHAAAAQEVKSIFACENRLTDVLVVVDTLTIVLIVCWIPDTRWVNCLASNCL